MTSSVRVRVEHPFRVVKQEFGHAKVHYRGLAANTARLTMLFALGKLSVKKPGLRGVDRRQIPLDFHITTR